MQGGFSVPDNLVSVALGSGALSLKNVSQSLNNLSCAQSACHILSHVGYLVLKKRVPRQSAHTRYLPTVEGGNLFSFRSFPFFFALLSFLSFRFLKI